MFFFVSQLPHHSRSLPLSLSLSPSLALALEHSSPSLSRSLPSSLPFLHSSSRNLPLSGSAHPFIWFSLSGSALPSSSPLHRRKTHQTPLPRPRVEEGFVDRGRRREEGLELKEGLGGFQSVILEEKRRGSHRCQHALRPGLLSSSAFYTVVQ